MKHLNARISTDRESTYASDFITFKSTGGARRLACVLGLAWALGLGGCRATTPGSSNSGTPNGGTPNNGSSNGGGPRDFSAGGNTRFDERGASNGTSNSGGPQIEAHFSPHGGCTDALLREINGARRSIWVQAFSFTSAPISDALLKAHKRGVQVRIVLDKGQETARYSGATFMQNGGVPILIDHKHAIAHNKIMIFDGQTLATGSFNFTKNAENSNAENLLVIKNAPNLLRQYQDNFEAHAAHSTPYERRESSSSGGTTGRE